MTFYPLVILEGYCLYHSLLIFWYHIWCVQRLPSPTMTYNGWYIPRGISTQISYIHERIAWLYIQFNCRAIYYLTPGGGCEVLFSPGLSVCLCVSVCPADILVFYFSGLVTFKRQGHRDGTLLFEGTVISQKLSHRKISICFHRHLLGYSIRWNNKNERAEKWRHKKYVNIWL